MTEANYQQRIKELEEELKEKELYITQLEQLNEAYDKLEELTHKELMDADQIFRAQEIVSEAMRKEQLDARQTIEAHERIAELSVLEKQEAKKVIEVQEELTHLSVKELQERDLALGNILKISRDLSRILDQKKMLRKIVTSLMSTLKAKRGILYLYQNQQLTIKVRKNIPLRVLKSANFVNIKKKIDEVQKTRKGGLWIFHGNTREPVWSALAVPLVYEKKCLGVIYLDLISSEQNFRQMDLEIAEIFSLDAAILLNNVALYEKIKNQNLELLKLLNIKNQMIEQLSEEVEIPAQKIDTQIRKIFDRFNLDLTQQKDAARVLSLLDKMRMTLSRVINLQELEKEVDDLFRDEMDFRELFTLILKSHSQVIKEKNIDVSLKLSPHCYLYHGNRIILRTLFDELVSNAVFYNRENGKVWIRGFKRGDHLVFEVKDTGTGISEDDLKHIFEQFYRSDTSEELNARGAGLGLYMVKSFVQHYRGDVQVKSRPGEGSAFTVKLLVN